MGMRLTQVPKNSNTGELTDPIGYETTFDGQTFFWAPGEKRVFGSDAQGVGHAANSGAGSPAAGVIEDNGLSTKRFPGYESRS